MTLVFYIDKVLTSITKFVQKIRKCSGVKKNKVENKDELHKYEYQPFPRPVLNSVVSK
jgi:predicted transcriptional regulator